MNTKLVDTQFIPKEKKMEISKKYKDELGNEVFLDMEDDDVHITVKYNEKSVGRCKDDAFFLMKKDFEKIKELYEEYFDALEKEKEK